MWMLLIVVAAAAAAAQDCPVDFNYVSAFPSNLAHCRRSSAAPNRSDCCPALLSTFGIGLADYLNRSGGFEFPDIGTATSCTSSFQSHLDSHNAGADFVRDCSFPPSRFVQSPVCAGVRTLADWNRVVSPDLDRALFRTCSGDVSNPLHCQSCTNDITQVVLELQSLSNISAAGQQCVYSACLYAAGVVNRIGPRDPSTAACILGVTTQGPRIRNRGSHARIYVAVGVAGAVSVAVLAGLSLFFRSRRNREREEHQLQNSTSAALSRMPNLGLIRFSYDELRSATQNFSSKNFLGEGGYGRVYRGTLPKRSNSAVAIKVMKLASQESNAGFLNEVEVINRVRHRNLVHVLGACVHTGTDSQQLLVYEYMPNGCLQTYLSSGALSWPQRRKIAIGIAVGINYLHNEVDPAIIHRDIKPSNILLDEDLNARVADFGLAKINLEGMSHLTSRVAGTPIYMAIEYALYGQCSDRVDVYSFGILLLELMSGRRALDTNLENPAHYHIVDWAWSLVKAGRLTEIVDQQIQDRDPETGFVQQRFVLVGILCAHLLVAVRPTIAQALKLLEGDDVLPPIPDRPPPYIVGMIDGDGAESDETFQTEDDDQIKRSRRAADPRPTLI